MASADGAADIPVFTNRPNPLNPETEVTFSLDRDQVVTLSIYDISGRCLRTLINGPLLSGVHRVVWDGKDNLGTPVASGMYFCRLEKEGQPASTRKMLLVK